MNQFEVKEDVNINSLRHFGKRDVAPAVKALMEAVLHLPVGPTKSICITNTSMTEKQAKALIVSCRTQFERMGYSPELKGRTIKDVKGNYISTRIFKTTEDIDFWKNKH